MSEASESIDVLEAQMTAIEDTKDNLAGLIEKAARIQSDLLSAGFSEFADALAEPFSAMSNAADRLQSLFHDVEIERNRIRNEA